MEDKHTAIVPFEGKEQAVSEVQDKGIYGGYDGASVKPVELEQFEALTSEISWDEVEIKPDGIPYMPQINYRRRLNKAFGPMGWALIPRGEIQYNKDDNIMYRQYALFASGRFVAEAIGSQQYHENNRQMDYADAAEGVKSNALARCCKDIGIASELWDKSFLEAWKREHAIQVWVRDKHGDTKLQWRRKDREKLPYETGSKSEGKPSPNVVDTHQSVPPQQQSQSNPKLITEKQRKRLYAIASNSGCGGDTFKDELIKMGFSSSTEIPKDQYEDICTHFESLK